MTKRLMLLALLAACGGDSAHDVIDCEAGAWSGTPFTGTRCERGCAAGPICAANDTACLATLPTCKQPDGRIDCGGPSQANFDGERGCCQPDASNALVFTACEGE